MRTCIGCRRARMTDVLVRVVLTGGGSLTVDRNLPGRGAWLCRDSPGCVDLAVKRHGFSRALRGEVEDAEVDRLRTAVRSRSAVEAGPGSEGPVL